MDTVVFLAQGTVTGGCTSHRFLAPGLKVGFRVGFWYGVLKVAPFPPDEVSKNDYICERMTKEKWLDAEMNSASDSGCVCLRLTKPV